MGNNRVVVNEDGTIEQTTHYYPFGGVFADADTNAALQPYKYNGKELDRTHGLDTYDYGARQYYAPLLTWDRVDPLCEKYYHLNPYAYCGNNPVSYIDERGDSISLSGSIDDVNKTIGVLNNSLNGFYNISADLSGVLSINAIQGTNVMEMSNSQKAIYKRLDEVINHQGLATIHVVNNSSSILFGSITDRIIDIGDMLNVKSEKMNALSILMHELSENYDVHVLNRDVKKSHEKASRLEGKITGYMLDPWKREITENGRMKIPVLYPQYEEDVNIEIHNNNIIK